jgi:RNA polymerase sigma-70 factor, ECF subfamily
LNRERAEKVRQTSLVSTQDNASLLSLMEEARRGFDAELGRLLESFRSALMKLAEEQIESQLQRRFSTSDLVQETMLTAALRFAAFRGSSTEEFRNWLWEVFHSRLIDGVRRHQLAERRRQSREEHAVQLSEICDESQSPSLQVLLREDAARLLRALATLEPSAQELIRMRYLEDLTFEEIAERRQQSLATVWRHFHAATAALHSLLREKPKSPASAGIRPTAPPLRTGVSDNNSTDSIC